MKNQLLLISTLMFAGTTSAMAWDNIDGGISGYTYNEVDYAWQTSVKGKNEVTGVTNSTWSGKTVDLGTDARYILIFQVQSHNGTDGGAQPIFNVYLANPQGGSILYGNYYGMGTNYQNGAAGFATYGGDVSNGDLITAGSPTYVLNSWIKDTSYGGVVNWLGSTLKGGPSTGTNLANGYHRYEVIIESFADENQKDLIKFKYSGANNQSGSWSRDWDLASLGLSTNSVLNIGWFTETDGGTMSVTNATFQHDQRSLIPPPPTEPDQPSTDPDAPETPEPSAFGLLAGLGAIALAASRRRRK